MWSAGNLVIFTGITSVLAVIIFSLRNRKNPNYVGLGVLLCAFAFVGFLINRQDKISHIDIPKFGSLDQVVNQISVSAQTVEDLKTRVENQSATVDAIARQSADAASLSKTAANQIDEARKKLDTINVLVAKATDTLEQLNSSVDFTKLVIQAQNDDRKAFDQLGKIAGVLSNPNSTNAAEAYKVISSSHAAGISYEYTVPWNVGIDPLKLTSSNLQDLYYTMAGDIQVGLLQYFSKREDIPKIDRLDFLFQVLNKDDHLKNAEYAGRAIDALTGQNFVPLPTDFLNNWWSTHRSDFVSKAEASKSQP